MKSVSLTTATNYQVRLTTGGGHTLISDEAVAEGGDGAGPTPYELVLSALSACTAITLIMYARRKKWPIEAVEVDATHEKVVQAPPEGQDIVPPPLDSFNVKVRVHGQIDEDQRKRLEYIASRCPVHRTLLSTPKIVESLEVVPPASLPRT